MLDKEREERVYLREFARLAREVCGSDWPDAEALLRSVWPQRPRWLTLEEAIEVVRGYFGLE